MLLKLAALGTLGYVGYKYVQKNGGLSRLTESLNSWLPSDLGDQPDRDDPHVAMAGGPFSNDATLVRAGEPLPG